MTRAIAVACLLASVACSRGSSPSAEATAVGAEALAPAASSVADASSAKAFGAGCVTDGECAGGVCFHKRLKGPDAGKERRGADDPVERDGYCSLRCNDDSDCPVPPTKGRCGARGMCKRLD